MRIASNESPMERTLRIVAGAVLGWMYRSGSVPGAEAAVVLGVSLLLVVTGIVGYCPVYALLHRGTASIR